MGNKVRHTGTIERISDGVLHVKILQSSACAGCKVSAHCTASESKEKEIDVYGEDVSLYSVGQHVVLSTYTGMGFLATLYAYVVPFVLMLGVLVVTIALTDNEIKGAFAALLSLLPYYIVLYMLRDKIKRQVYFQIDKS